MGEGEEPKKKNPETKIKKIKNKKTRVSEDRELTRKRKGVSDRLFVLEIDLNLDESMDEPKIYVLELLSAKVKRQTSSKNHLYLPLKVTTQIFPPIKVRESPPLDHHRAVERGKHRAARI